MAKKLANEGFNICLVARNEEKMANCCKDISAMCPNIQTMSIKADFGKMRTLAEYRETIQEQLKDKDVAVLVCNAGYAPMAMFELQPDDYTENSIFVNVVHVVFTIKSMVEQLQKRKEV